MVIDKHSHTEHKTTLAAFDNAAPSR